MRSASLLSVSPDRSWYFGDSSVRVRLPIFVLPILALVAGALIPSALQAQLTSQQKQANLDSFDLVWKTVRDRHPDPALNGLDWTAIRAATRPRIESAASMDEVRDLLRGMLAKLQASHYAIIPVELYRQIDSQPVNLASALSPSSGPPSSAAPSSAKAKEAERERRVENGSPGIVPVVIGGKAVVGQVEPGSPAERAGIRPGMVLEGINGATLTPMMRFLDDLNNQESQQIVEQTMARRLDGPVDQPIAVDLVDERGAAKHVELGRTPPKGTLVHFGNLPETRLYFESKRLPEGTGYIRFNEFLDPASIMPQFQNALREFKDAPGIILDLRGNPGGIGIMAMGIAGFFIDKDGKKLGDMKMRDTTLKFVIFPRPETYAGPLAILVDEGSASTTEILAGGLQDLGRARIFGVRTAGAALPSDIIRLPNGDGFQYAQAIYTSVKGKVLEGAGVTPDTVVRQTREALLAGHDLVIEAAEQWIVSHR